MSWQHQQRKRLNPHLRPLIDKYCAAPAISRRSTARKFRLGWDFAASALASRNEQYERFYLTSGARNRQNVQCERIGPRQIVWSIGFCLRS